MSNSITQEEIDTIMEEMEAQTPKSIQIFGDLSGHVFDQAPEKVADDVDAKNAFSLFAKKPVKANKYVSMPTNERYYDCTNSNIGVAVIFNQMNFKVEQERGGSQKDTDDFKNVLLKKGFDVKVYNDSSVSAIKRILQSS